MISHRGTRISYMGLLRPVANMDDDCFTEAVAQLVGPRSYPMRATPRIIDDEPSEGRVARGRRAAMTVGTWTTLPATTSLTLSRIARPSRPRH